MKYSRLVSVVNALQHGQNATVARSTTTASRLTWLAQCATLLHLVCAATGHAPTSQRREAPPLFASQNATVQPFYFVILYLLGIKPERSEASIWALATGGQHGQAGGLICSLYPLEKYLGPEK